MAEQQKEVRTTARHRALTEDLQAATVEETTEFTRARWAEGTWSEWAPGMKRFSWNGIKLNLLAGGDWETVEDQPRRLTRQA